MGMCIHVYLKFHLSGPVWLSFFSHYRGGFGGGQGLPGKNGSISGTACPRGLYGIFCEVHEQPSFAIFSNYLCSWNRIKD